MVFLHIVVLVGIFLKDSLHAVGILVPGTAHGLQDRRPTLGAGTYRNLALDGGGDIQPFDQPTLGGEGTVARQLRVESQRTVGGSDTRDIQVIQYRKRVLQDRGKGFDHALHLLAVVAHLGIDVEAVDDELEVCHALAFADFRTDDEIRFEGNQLRLFPQERERIADAGKEERIDTGTFPAPIVGDDGTQGTGLQALGELDFSPVRYTESPRVIDFLGDSRVRIGKAVEHFETFHFLSIDGCIKNHRGILLKDGRIRRQQLRRDNKSRTFAEVVSWDTERCINFSSLRHIR